MNMRDKIEAIIWDYCKDDGFLTGANRPHITGKGRGIRLLCVF